MYMYESNVPCYVERTISNLPYVFIRHGIVYIINVIITMGVKKLMYGVAAIIGLYCSYSFMKRFFKTADR